MSLGGIGIKRHGTRDDERCFQLLRSRHSLRNVDLQDGWHPAEDRGWRWTRRSFSARVYRLPGSEGTSLGITVYVPDAVVSGHGSVQMNLQVDGVSLEPFVFKASGVFHLARTIPEAVKADTALVSGRVNHVVHAPGKENDDFGIVIDAMNIR